MPTTIMHVERCGSETSKTTKSAGRLLVECSYVFFQPWVHSGIQRVVRNIAEASKELENHHARILVAFFRNKVFEINRLLPEKPIGLGQLARLYSWLHRLQAAVARKLASKEALSLPFMHKSALKFAGLGAGAIIVMLRRCGFDPVLTRAREFGPNDGDTLLLLDSSWHDPSFLSQVEELKAQGVRVVAVVYDLIPIRKSEFCVPNIRVVLNEWLDRMIVLSDAFVCISKWVAGEVQDEIKARIGEEAMRKKAYGWFHLGSELDRKTGTHPLSEGMVKCFDDNVTTFLVVGTVEPRKNHKATLDAFDQHWVNGGQSKLCIVGRVGWMCDDIVSRLKSHPETGRRLFWFNNAGDDDLEYAYQNSDALIFASFVEGFGLPLVEGLQRGLPAIASDIPVFREVAGDFAEYFDPNSASDLCAIIDQFSVTKKLPNVRPVTEWKWITWKESAQQLFSAVDQCCRELDERRSLSNAHQH